MEASSFNESNHVLDRPRDMSDDECSPLSAFAGEYPNGQPVVISCWKLTKEELEIFNRTGRIWLHVLGVTMPPVYLGAANPFEGVSDVSAEPKKE